MTEEKISLWKVTLDSQQLGPLEFYVQLNEESDSLKGHSLSGALESIRQLPKAKQSTDVHLDSHLFSFSAAKIPGQSKDFAGRLESPWKEEGLEISISDRQLSGSVRHWLLGGTLNGVRVESVEPIRSYPPLMETFDSVVSNRIFSPQALESPEYSAFRDHFESIATASKDDLDVVIGFHFAWENDPFSHFQLRRSQITSEEMFKSFDAMDVGYEAARLRIEDEIGILRVDTMMGNDTIQQIRNAYKKIAESDIKGLILDLRGNGGGAFAVKPLVEHIIDKPITGGYFLSQPWFSKHDRLPNEQEIVATPTWTGWSISSFWRTVQDEGIMKLHFEPAEPNFNGPVWVLVDRRSASATELAVDVLKSSGAATIAGERTAGEMLSQSFFDLSDGFVISLPVADYYSMQHGRIESNGVEVNHAVHPDQALEYAKSMILRPETKK